MDGEMTDIPTNERIRTRKKIEEDYDVRRGLINCFHETKSNGSTFPLNDDNK